MTGIFANDTYNNGVTRDNFAEYAHTFDSNARYDNMPPEASGRKETIPYDNDRKALPRTSNRTPSNNSNNKGGGGGGNNRSGKGGAFAAISIIVIIIFAAIWAVNLYYNMQDVQYYGEKLDAAKEQVAVLESMGYGNFIIPSTLFY